MVSLAYVRRRPARRRSGITSSHRPEDLFLAMVCPLSDVAADGGLDEPAPLRAVRCGDRPKPGRSSCYALGDVSCDPRPRCASMSVAPYRSSGSRAAHRRWRRTLSRIDHVIVAIPPDHYPGREEHTFPSIMQARRDGLGRSGDVVVVEHTAATSTELEGDAGDSPRHRAEALRTSVSVLTGEGDISTRGSVPSAARLPDRRSDVLDGPRRDPDARLSRRERRPSPALLGMPEDHGGNPAGWPGDLVGDQADGVRSTG